MSEQLTQKKADDHDVIYALRTAHQNQTQLNLMADQKANIIVGTILIFLTFLITRYHTLDLSDTRAIILLTAIVSFELIAMLLGIMVIKPRTNWSRQTQKIDDMPNPLFFGFFTRHKEQEYVDFMLQQMQDNVSARDMLIKDLYQIGLILKRKFTLLKYAYNFAVAGVLLGVLSLTIQLILDYIR